MITTGDLNVAQSSDWKVVRVGDTDGDTHPDILWRSASTGNIAQWLVAGRNVLWTGTIGQPGADWKITAK